MPIPGSAKAALFCSQIEMLLVFQHQTGARHIAAWGESLHQGRDRHHKYAAHQRWQAIQRCNTLRDDIGMRRKQIVGQGFPIGELQHFDCIVREYADFGLERMRAVRIARDHDDDTGVPTCGFGDDQSERRTVRRVPVATLFRVDRQRGCQKWLARGCGWGIRSHVADELLARDWRGAE